MIGKRINIICVCWRSSLIRSGWFDWSDYKKFLNPTLSEMLTTHPKSRTVGTALLYLLLLLLDLFVLLDLQSLLDLEDLEDLLDLVRQDEIRWWFSHSVWKPGGPRAPAVVEIWLGRLRHSPLDPFRPGSPASPGTPLLPFTRDSMKFDIVLLFSIVEILHL